MAQSIQEPEHVWLVMRKAMRALTRYAAAAIEQTGLGLSDWLLSVQKPGSASASQA